jgi:hypothetical protein
MQRYLFTLELAGEGETPEEAWKDACEAFEQDNGTVPEDYIIE